MDDVVVFQSVKRALRLHVSPYTLPEAAHGHCQVTASQVEPTSCVGVSSMNSRVTVWLCCCEQSDMGAAWRVCRFTDHSPTLHKYITSGTVLRITHMETEV